MGRICRLRTVLYVKLNSQRRLSISRKEAERVNSSSDHWKPGIQYGKNVKSFRKLPIAFQY